MYDSNYYTIGDVVNPRMISPSFGQVGVIFGIVDGMGFITYK